MLIQHLKEALFVVCNFGGLADLNVQLKGTHDLAAVALQLEDVNAPFLSMLDFVGEFYLLRN